VELTKRFGAEGIYANSLMPGAILTDIVRKNLSIDELKQRKFIDDNGKPGSWLKSVEQGAATSVWAAVAHELDGIGGLYLEDCAIAKQSIDPKVYKGFAAFALDADNARKLWNICETWLENPPKTAKSH
jgi:NAD(P)-dependent dehydrogenase (short-subunit alcohol dehydrogenase family)